MIHIIYGDDDLAREENLTALKASSHDDQMSDMNTVFLDGSSVSPDELIQTCNTVPFLADQRIVIVRGLLSRLDGRGRRSRANNGGASQDEWNGLSEALSSMPPTTTLIMVDNSVNGNNSLLKALRPVAKVEHCRLPRERDMQMWIRQRAHSLGVKIEPKAVVDLVSAIGNNTRMMASEMEKLTIYRDGQEIRHQDVASLVPAAREANIFNMVDAAIEGNAGRAIQLAHDLIDEGTHPMVILSMVARQVRLLLLAKDMVGSNLDQDSIGRKLSLSGYPLSKTLQQQRKFSQEQLEQMHEHLVVTDLSIKTGAADEDIAIDSLILNLASIVT